MSDNVILRFSEVTFEYAHNKPILDEVSFSIRSGSRITLMGQNGAGKSSLFKLITGELQPKEGAVHLTPKDASIAIARQVMPQDAMGLTVHEYFATAFKEKEYALDKMIKNILEVVHLELPQEQYGTKQVKTFSGGQQARLLLAHALIQNPDVLLLDEPTNNLDKQGIEHLTGFLMMYEKTCLVISHDADFLNAFSDGVLYLDVHSKKVEQYSGNYYDVVEEIKNRIERENAQNARMQMQIKEKRAQAEVFAHKGGKLRAVAKRMRETVEEAEEGMVSVRMEDKTIRDFIIPTQEFDKFFDGKIMEFTQVSSFKDGEKVTEPFEFVLRKDTHVLIEGPNGIGKSTLLHDIATSEVGVEHWGFKIASEIKVGYYKQDFSNFDFEKTGYDALKEVMAMEDEHVLRSTAAGFLLDGKMLGNKIAALSEGQKGLLAFCRLVLQKPALLILDEPTNHINFRHLPVIAKALDEYEGAMLMVSHIPDFIAQVRIDQTVDLAAL